MKWDELKKKFSIKQGYTLRSVLILCFSTLIVLVIGFISLYSTYFFTESMTSKIAESRLDVLTQVSDKVLNIQENAETNFDLYWYNCFTNMKYVVNEDELVERFVEIGILFYTTDGLNNEDYEYVFVLDTGFSYSSNRDHDSYSFEDYQNEEWYSDVENNLNDAIWVSAYQNYSEEGEYIISLVRPMVDEGKITGLFLLNIREDTIYETYESVIADNDIYILDNSGNVFSHSDKEMLGNTYNDMSEINSSLDDTAATLQKNYKIIEKDGEDVLFSTLSSSQQGWIFVEEIPLSIVLADVTSLTNSLWVCAVLGVFLALLAIFLISHYTTKPLKELVTQLEMVGRDTEDETQFYVKGWEEINKICDECNFMDQRIRKLIYDVQETERDKSRIELGFLQAQMSPHFMYNTLFSIKCLVDMDDKQGAIDTLNAFTAILKYILSYKTDYVTISEEIELLEDYVKLQKVLYGDKFSVNIQCETELYDKKILRMIVQPLVENSLQHGVAGDKDKVRVDVSFQLSDEGLYIKIVDDGVGFDNHNLERLYKKVDKVDDTTKKNSNMIGLNNIRQRIKKRYRGEYGVFIDSEYENGAKIVVKLPNNIGEE